MLSLIKELDSIYTIVQAQKKGHEKKPKQTSYHGSENC